MKNSTLFTTLYKTINLTTQRNYIKSLASLYMKKNLYLKTGFTSAKNTKNENSTS